MGSLGFIIASCVLFLHMVSSERSFKIDFDNNSFLKDGKPFRYMSGSLHYFRVPWQLWADRMQKMKMAGLNAIQTYVEWNHHEPEPGIFNFNGNYDLVKFLRTALSLDMIVILRTGPFIDAERDMGGLPYWLLRINPGMQLRSYDSTYIEYVDKWFEVLLPMLRPLLYNNGGPIVSMQLENEYGSYSACDFQYTTHLRDLFKKYLKDEVILFTTDGSQSRLLMCGKIDGVFSACDFGTGTDVEAAFNTLRLHQSSGPLINSEFYPGWLDHWGEPHQTVDTNSITKTLSQMLAANASVNIYMFHGGTSFGFSAGSNSNGANSFQACPTSYDYDAPLTEAGDPTQKYYSIRTTIGQYLPLPPGPVPVPSPKMELSPVTMKKLSSLWDFLPLSSDRIFAQYPLSFEELKQPYGFVIYQVELNIMPTDPAVLNVPGLRDRGHVYVNERFQGILSRELNVFSMPIKIQKGQWITILVENQGRICFGSGISDRKGIIQNVTVGSTILSNWTMIPVNLTSESLAVLEEMALDDIDQYQRDNRSTPAFYSGTFTLPGSTVYDSYLRLDGWHKGVAFFNGFNLGRYWPIVGPQVTLYVPHVLFKKPPLTNVIIVLELEHAPCSNPSQCILKFVKDPVVNGTTPVNFNFHNLNNSGHFRHEL